MSFSLNASLDTREPLLIEFLGPPSSVTHSITGVLQLHVEKPVQLRQLSVAFVGQIYQTFGRAGLTVKSDPINTDRVEQHMIEAPTLYRPGDYSFPFELRLPGDMATTDCSKLVTHSLLSEYLLVASAMPVGLVARRKEHRQHLTVRRVHVEPSNSNQARYTAKRSEQIECSLYCPRFVSLSQDKAFISMYIHAYTSAHCVKEIQIRVFQNEWIELTSSSHSPERRGQRFAIINIYNSKCISEPAIVPNPDQESFATAWGRETPIEFEVELLPALVQPTELLNWFKLGHHLHLTIIFADETIKPLNVKAPFAIRRIMEDAWMHHALRTNERDSMERERAVLPGYGEEMEVSTLLDSNTHRVENINLYRELYPERGELLVPDVTDDHPPIYDHGAEQSGRDADQPEQESGKS
ncbi:hypothetical protein BGZ98_005093 [Dissophora globulifera]|nr:hypothetical protein BGZ98_005093 [Dissophora globulifera]